MQILLFIHFCTLLKLFPKDIFIVNELIYIVSYSMTKEINNEDIILKIIFFDKVKHSNLIFYYIK